MNTKLISINLILIRSKSVENSAVLKSLIMDAPPVYISMHNKM